MQSVELQHNEFHQGGSAGCRGLVRRGRSPDNPCHGAECGDGGGCQDDRWPERTTRPGGAAHPFGWPQPRWRDGVRNRPPTWRKRGGGGSSDPARSASPDQFRRAADPAPYADYRYPGGHLPERGLCRCLLPDGGKSDRAVSVRSLQPALELDAGGRLLQQPPPQQHLRRPPQHPAGVSGHGEPLGVLQQRRSDPGRHRAHGLVQCLRSVRHEHRHQLQPHRWPERPDQRGSAGGRGRCGSRRIKQRVCLRWRRSALRPDLERGCLAQRGAARCADQWDGFRFGRLPDHHRHDPAASLCLSGLRQRMHRNPAPRCRPQSL